MFWFGRLPLHESMKGEIAKWSCNFVEGVHKLCEYIYLNISLLRAFHVSIAQGSKVGSIKGERFFSSGPQEACPQELAWRQQGCRPGAGKCLQTCRLQKEEIGKNGETFVPRYLYAWSIWRKNLMQAVFKILNALTAWNIEKPSVSVKLGGFRFQLDGIECARHADVNARRPNRCPVMDA